MSNLIAAAERVSETESRKSPAAVWLGESKRELHNFASRYCTCAVNEGYKQFSAKEFDELSGEDLERFMDNLVKGDPCNLARYHPEFVKP